MRSGLAALLALAVSVSSLSAERALPVEGSPFRVTGISQTEASDFLKQLQGAVGKGDAAAVAALTHFPLLVNGKPGPRDAAEFTRDFHTLFNDRVRSAAHKASPATLFPTYRGVLIGGGTLIYGLICDGQVATSNECKGKRSVALTAIRNRSLKIDATL
jgi:hypothetical protein